MSFFSKSGKEDRSGGGHRPTAVTKKVARKSGSRGGARGTRGGSRWKKSTYRVTCMTDSGGSMVGLTAPNPIILTALWGLVAVAVMSWKG